MFHPTHLRLVLLPLWFVVAVLPLTNTHAEAFENTSTSIRAVIEHLAEAYPERYPNGPQFLERLDVLEAKVKKAGGGFTEKLRSELKSLEREAILANPLLTSQPIVFVTRHQYRPDHHNTGTMFVTSEVNARSFQGGGAIKAIDFANDGKVETLLQLPKGVARDLEVNFDGNKILFAMRRNREENYHIFQMEKEKADAFSLRQLTSKADVADIDPMYLPNGQIVFASTRDAKYCGCNQHIQANLFRMSADGSNIHQIGRNNLFESRPSMMPDGRILYDRWEYVDRHFGPSFGLWTSAPDGCNHALFYGNNAWSPGAIFDAQVLPNSQRVIATLGACHDRPWGALAIIDRRLGLDGEEPLVYTWPSNIKQQRYLANQQNYNQGQDKRHPAVDQIDLFQKLPVKYEDPFPLDEYFFLCSRMTGNGEQMGIYLLDTFGNETLLYAEEQSKGLGCFDPRPLAPRPRPPIIPDRIDLSKKTGTFYVADVYQGTAMKNVPRGTIKTLRVVEAPPKRYFTHPLWQLDTLQRPAMNYNSTNNKRILGDAPVESDGSAYFEVPADRFVFFQALDANGQMVQSMRSGTTLRPGEHTGCIGCHDRRYDSVNTSGMPVSMAMRRGPSKLKKWYGPTREFNYLTEVQPVFDRYCVSCHDYGKDGGKALNLAGDLGLAFNTSYLELRGRSPLRWFPDKESDKKPLIKAVDDGPPEVLPPYAWGSHRSRLIDILRGNHYDVKLDPESFDRIISWIDLNAPYYGSYASNYPGNLFGRSPLDGRQLERLAELTGISVATKTPGHPLQGTQVNFTRPELSPCLAVFKSKEAKHGSRYNEAISIIQEGRKTLYRTTRADMPNFALVNNVDSQRYRRRLKKQAEEKSVHRAILQGKKRFDKGDKTSKHIIKGHVLYNILDNPIDPNKNKSGKAVSPNSADALENLKRLCQAVNELGNTYPESYPRQKILAKISVLRRQVRRLTNQNQASGKEAWSKLLADITALKRYALVEENPLLKHRKILFAKRYAYCPGWYYADFNYATHFGGNLCVLSIDSGEVKELVPELNGGIFDRFDLSFDAQHIVFGYKKAKGYGFRLYEIGVDGQGLRQITTDPPDEAERMAKYQHPHYGKNGAYQFHTDDFHPCYLPDGGICFTSTRCERGVLCDQADHLTVNTLYRVERDGSKMQPLSEGALSESTPTVTNDGRILYTRWEYVDKGVIAVQSLWAMRPDGSGSVEIFGGQHDFPPVLIHGRAIPGKNHLFVATGTMHHPFAVGPIHLINTRYPLLTQEPLQSLTPDTSLWIDGVGSFPRGEQFTHRKDGRWVPDNKGPLFADPYPLTDPKNGDCSATFFLVTCNPDKPWNDRKAYGLYLIDKFGNRVEVYSDPAISCWQPMILEPRPTPPVLPSLIGDQQYVKEAEPGKATAKNALLKEEATVVISNIYAGLEDVEHGTVKYLRVWEQLPRPWSARRFWPHDTTLGQHAVISLNAHIYVKVLHGIVPVEKDGSAHFTVPADKNIFFQALDENYMEVQRMRTFVNFQPGEKRSCVGCHVTAQTAPANVSMTAISHSPVAPTPQPGEVAPRPIHYITDIQPIFERHCVKCHNERQSDGNLDLSGKLTTFFNRSYEQIMRKNLVTHIQEFQGPQKRAQKSNTVSLPPYSLGSHASPLIQVLRKKHYEVELSEAEWIKLITWVDSNAPYYGSYFGRRNLMYRQHPDFRPVPTLESTHE